MAVTIDRHSYLRFAELVTLDSVDFWDVVDMPTIPEQIDDVQYRVLSTDRLDLLADKFYGDATLQWVIALANDIELWPTELNVGDTLRIPAPRYIAQQFFAEAKNK